MFARPRRVVIDELHALADAKRGQLLALGLARLCGLAPRRALVGLSATVDRAGAAARLSVARAGARRG